MFERIAVRTKSPRWKTAMIVGTTAGHAAVTASMSLLLLL